MKSHSERTFKECKAIMEQTPLVATEREKWNECVDVLRKQLAAERKRYSAATWDMADLRRELAAEREKLNRAMEEVRHLVKLNEQRYGENLALVDALKDQAEMTAYYNGKAKEHWRNYLTPKAKAALAKVKEGSK